MAAPQTWNFEADLNAFSHVDISKIAGNAPDHAKKIVGNPQNFCDVYRAKGIGRGFGEGVQQHMRVTEVSVKRNAEEPNRMEGRMVMELEVHEDMLNPGAALHGACCAYMVDMWVAWFMNDALRLIHGASDDLPCSTFVLLAMNLSSGKPLTDNVSQTINIVYHSPALLGDTLRVVNTTLAMGSKTQSMKTEIWNVSRKRLVASGTHLKMAIPPAPKKANL